MMSDLNHYHYNSCDSTWTSDETAEKCPACESLDIHEAEFDEMGVAKWRLEKYENDPVAALRG